MAGNQKEREAGKMNEEYVYHVDKKDKVIGKVTRKEKRDRNLIGRSIAAFVFNSKGEILVQKRSMSKKVFPGYYDPVVCGNVTYGDSYESTAKKEVEEEVGIKNPKIDYLFDLLVIHEVNSAYYKVFKLNYDGPIEIQEEELESAEFMPIEKIKEMMEKEKFGPGGILIFKKYLEEYHGK